jgi:hypothetical protein
MGENEKARSLGYLDGRAGRIKSAEIPVAQSRAYAEGHADGVACRERS